MASLGLCGSRRGAQRCTMDLEEETKPMEGTSGVALATARCRNGLVSGGRPWSALARREVAERPGPATVRWGGDVSVGSGKRTKARAAVMRYG